MKRKYLQPLAITISDLAKTLNVSRKTMSKIINECGAITSDMALRLSKAFETIPELWMNLQVQHDLWDAARTHDEWQSVRPIKRQAL